MNKQLGSYDKDWLTHGIIGAAIEVHKEMGPGLLERIYENALCVELGKRSIRYAQQKPIAAKYKGQIVGDLYVDLLVEDKVMVELKSVKELNADTRSTVDRIPQTGKHQDRIAH